MEKTVAKVIIESLEKCGVVHTFGMPGSQNLELFDCLVDSNIKNVLVTNELFASFMACGYSWVTGKIGVCISISGPGLTNMFTGLAEALVDSIPILVLATGVKMKEKSFQVHQVKQIEAVRPIVKDVFSMKTADEAPEVIFKAFNVAQMGEPGPVVIEIPEDLLGHPLTPTLSPLGRGKKGEGSVESEIDKEKINEILKILKNSKFCGIYAGQGTFDASKEIIKLSEAISAPVATTVSGKGAIPEDHPLSVGFGFGPSGTEISEEVFKKCDTILAIGCKFSEMATGGWGFKLPENLIHIDRNIDVLEKNYPAKISLCLDAKSFFKVILNHIDEIRKDKNWQLIGNIKKGKEKYFEKIQTKKMVHPVRNAKILAKCPSISNWVHPARFFYELRKQMKRDAILTTDCGYHQLWSITDFPVFKPRTFITSPDYQAMGFGIPAAIGAKVAYPEREVVCVCGDGGFLISGFELLTAVREKLNIIVIIFNDRELGLIKYIQQKRYNRVSSVDFASPDFEILAKSFGVEYVEIGNNDKIEEGFKKAFSKKKSVIVNVKIKYEDEPRYLQGRRKTFWNRLSLEEKLKLSAKIVKRRKEYGYQRN